MQVWYVFLFLGAENTPYVGLASLHQGAPRRRCLLRSKEQRYTKFPAYITECKVVTFDIRTNKDLL